MFQTGLTVFLMTFKVLISDKHLYYIYIYSFHLNRYFFGLNYDYTFKINILL